MRSSDHSRRTNNTSGSSANDAANFHAAYTATSESAMATAHATAHAAAHATELPVALALPVSAGALVPAGGWAAARARGDDINLHPDAGTSLGELGSMGYPVYGWRRREKDVDAHLEVHAEARITPPHPDGERGARRDGAVLAEPVPVEAVPKLRPIYTLPPPHVMLNSGVPLAGLGSGMGMSPDAHHFAAMAQAMMHGVQGTSAMGGAGGVGGQMHPGFHAMRRVYMTPRQAMRM